MKYILNNDNLEVVGKQYLNGVGNYTGNTTNASDLATVINAKAEKSEIPTESTVSNWGFTKNQGTVKDIKANGVPLTQNNGEVNITAADLGLASALKYCGITTTPLKDGDTINPVVIDGKNHTAAQGCVVFYEDNENIKEFVFNGTKWELLGSDLTYKVVQTAVSSPNANGNAVSFIDTISQDANGVITATKKNVNMPIINGDAEYSAVLKGEYQGYSNKAISQTSMAVGAATTAGLKGWYYSAIDFANKTITLSDKPTYILIGTTLINGGWSYGTPNIKVNDVISLVNDSKYDLCSTVTAVSGNVITVDSLPFTELVKDNGAASAVIAGQFSDGYSIYVPESPDAGLIDLAGGAFAEGGQSKSTNICSHAEGLQTHAYGQYSHAEGRGTKAGYAAHAEGRGTKAEGEESHAEGLNTTASGKHSHAEGDIALASGQNAHAEGYLSQAIGNSSHAEGGNWVKGATGDGRINGGTAEGSGSHAEGARTKAIGDYSHAEGYRSEAVGPNSHTEGQLTRTGGLDTDRPTGNPGTKSGQNAHAEGAMTFAQGAGSHAEGGKTWASGNYSHTEGWQTRTYEEANNSHAEGFYTETTNRAEHAEGEYNKSNSNTIHSVGIGTASLRKNAHEIMKNGKHYIYGIGCYDGTNPTDSYDIATYLPNMVNKTYLELVNLRKNGELIPGQQYRITDYTTTTVQENTQSAGHPFDIIVTADAVDVLNENARAIQHTNDENDYFHNSNLASWELKYCLDNDIKRFAWADGTNGKGVIYYMKDEWNNECPYDFKNIQFARWELSNPVGYRNDYDFENEADNWIEESTPFDSLKTGFYGLNGTENVFYYKEDEIEGYYRYKVEYTILESPTYCYTFGKGTDYSINGSNYDNIIKEYKSINKLKLNNIVFLSMSCYYNSFGNDCFKNSFGNTCDFNSFGNNCSYNSFGNNCSYNSFGNNCDSNSFGNTCDFNSFGNNCSRNSFGYSCYNNSFGNHFYESSLGNGCQYNSFGNYCSSNSFGNNCSNNSFRLSVSETGTLLDYCYYNHFDDGCSYNVIWNDVQPTDSNKLQNINVVRGVSGDSSNYNFINIVDKNTVYEIKVAKNSSGDIKVYCEADLIS